MSPLKDLKDIHLPAQISDWPPAWGWWLSAILVIVLLVWIIRSIQIAYRKRLAKRQALAQLNQLDSNSEHYQSEINTLLKRLTLSYLPRAQSASLHQQQWLTLLTQLLPTAKQQHFKTGYQKVIDNLYRPDASGLSNQDAKSLARQWIDAAIPPSSKRVAIIAQEEKDV
ncbi:DUF4381 family protein [Neptunicella marina]|uniref:DUF4381 domain-containing protein n=1 Tax=Neptunicella marina TaxID=2125989 RepID=A0A8J6M5T8_9ALTE|nr:DUF4381 domain-containing protein [Neptunicella marina]